MVGRSGRLWGVIAGVVATTSTAAAQEGQGWRYRSDSTFPGEPGGEITRKKPLTARQRNLALQAGGGYSYFTEAGARSVTGTGGEWTVRAVLRPARAIASEVAYVGSAHALFVPGLRDATLFESGLEWLVRAGIPFVAGGGYVVPYVTAGFGWAYWDLLGDDDDDQRFTGVQRSDVVFKVPVGLGVTAGVRGFTVDARVVYRHAVEDQLLEAANTTAATAGLDNLGIGGSVGYAF